MFPISIPTAAEEAYYKKNLELASTILKWQILTMPQIIQQ